MFEAEVYISVALLLKSFVHANRQLPDITCFQWTFQLYNALPIKVIGLIISLEFLITRVVVKSDDLVIIAH